MPHFGWISVASSEHESSTVPLDPQSFEMVISHAFSVKAAESQLMWTNSSSLLRLLHLEYKNVRGYRLSWSEKFP